MKVVLINPALVVLRADPFTTGIPYMPVSLAYAAAALRAAGHSVEVLDAFGEAPRQYRLDGKYMIRGLSAEEVAQRLPADAKAAVLYAISLTCHRSFEAILGAIRRRRPDLPIIALENTQAVTAYSLRRMLGRLFDLGARWVLCGEAEERLPRLLRAIEEGVPPDAVDGVGWRDAQGNDHFTEPTGVVADLDAVPFPAWELFPLKGYWSLRYAHGPLEADRYLPLLTSRGCPYPCAFCVIPETNNQRWRSRTPENVAAEMRHWRDRLGVCEFHIEDVNPTIDDARIQVLCRRILEGGLRVSWKIAAGTKVETIRSEETVRLMAQAGCRYISISPESGSADVLRRIRKPFDMEHALRIVAFMNRYGIRSQCCFVLGFPGETDEDRRKTWEVVRRFARHGVDEIAQFIVTPVPGSQIFGQFSGYQDYSDLNFSPTWRADFRQLSRFRLRLYCAFIFWKALYHPEKIFLQPWYFVQRRFHTKMEMTPYRALHTLALRLRRRPQPGPARGAP